MTTTMYPTLEHVAMQARPYPTHLLEGCETGLCLFAAAFLGHNDAVHFAEAGIPWVVCVDTDRERMEEMKTLYPSKWCFVKGDAWDYASHVTSGWFDVVSLDPFTGEMMERVLDDMEVWTRIAKRAVIVGAPPAYSVRNPRGWYLAEAMARSEIAHWQVWKPE